MFRIIVYILNMKKNNLRLMLFKMIYMSFYENKVKRKKEGARVIFGDIVFKKELDIT